MHGQSMVEQNGKFLSQDFGHYFEKKKIKRRIIILKTVSFSKKNYMSSDYVPYFQNKEKMFSFAHT